MVPAANGAAEARKRRKEIIQSQRSDTEVAAAKDDEELAETASKQEKKPPKKRKMDESKGKNKEKDTDSDIDSDTDDEGRKKTQIRYDPEVPMDKDQLAAWRREARRVRNRESAAASRQRIRNRINELEDEVGQWKAKYSQAMERLSSLQQSITNDDGQAAKV